MTTILSTYFPSYFKALYWFIDGGADFFTMENSFVAHDFLFIDYYKHYFSGKDILEELQTFLVRLDEKGVKWLLCLPDNRIVRVLFSEFNVYRIPGQRNRKTIPALCITNYDSAISSNPKNSPCKMIGLS